MKIFKSNFLKISALQGAPKKTLDSIWISLVRETKNSVRDEKSAFLP